MPLLDDLDKRRERELQDRENSARLAQAYASVQTVGTGSIENDDRISFGTTFIEKPFMSYGAVVDMEQIADALEIDPDEDGADVQLPLCTGYVTEWDQDQRGFYVGCWVAMRIHFPSDATVDENGIPVDADPQFEIEHHFTFAAIAMKDIPDMAPADFEEET